MFDVLVVFRLVPLLCSKADVPERSGVLWCAPTHCSDICNDNDCNSLIAVLLNSSYAYGQKPKSGKVPNYSEQIIVVKYCLC